MESMLLLLVYTSCLLVPSNDEELTTFTSIQKIFSVTTSIVMATGFTRLKLNVKMLPVSLSDVRLMEYSVLVSETFSNQNKYLEIV